jgi:hypothetical protein
VNFVYKLCLTYCILFYRKIVELEEELRVVGNNLKSLEVSEEKVRSVETLLNPNLQIIFNTFKVVLCKMT